MALFLLSGPGLTGARAGVTGARPGPTGARPGVTGARLLKAVCVPTLPGGDTVCHHGVGRWCFPLTPGKMRRLLLSGWVSGLSRLRHLFWLWVIVFCQYSKVCSIPSSTIPRSQSTWGCGGGWGSQTHPTPAAPSHSLAMLVMYVSRGLGVHICFECVSQPLSHSAQRCSVLRVSAQSLYTAIQCVGEGMLCCPGSRAPVCVGRSTSQSKTGQTPV